MYVCMYIFINIIIIIIIINIIIITSSSSSVKACKDLKQKNKTKQSKHEF